MRRLWLITIVAGALLVIAPSASALDDWCAPEYGSCSGDPKDGTGGEVSGGGQLRDGTREYGGYYWQCSASPRRTGMCWECAWNPYKRTRTCVGVSHSAHCYCTETVRNYVIVECNVHGTCSYSDV